MNHPKDLTRPIVRDWARLPHLAVGTWLLVKLPELTASGADPMTVGVQALTGLTLLGMKASWVQVLARGVGR